MLHQESFDPTGRFTGLADQYARYRPSYPAEVIDFIVAHADLKVGSVLVDVGCGTGIASRLFAAQGLEVVGVDPNADMLRSAAATPVAEGPGRVTYLTGQAEQTGLPGDFADAVLAAQAFHWFDPSKALAEFRRILKPGGWVALVWNERDESDPFTAAYGRLLRSASTDAAAVELPRGRAGEPLLTSPLFERPGRYIFANEQVVDEDGLIGRAFSASYAPREPAPAAGLQNGMRKLFAAYHREGRVVLRYETSVYLARRPPAP